MTQAFDGAYGGIKPRGGYLTNFNCFPAELKCKTERLPESIARLNQVYDNVQVFVAFLGYSRRIDGVIGNILDAHGEVLLPQEYDIISK